MSSRGMQSGACARDYYEATAPHSEEGGHINYTAANAALASERFRHRCGCAPVRLSAASAASALGCPDRA
jgi:hypothetical protein